MSGILPASPLVAHAIDVGFYGKLPSHGDFLRRRVSDAFVGVWDGWLQSCVAASRTALGDRWLDVYLTSPAWRFVCAAGACGPLPVAGVLVPSVDRVGRYFPLTLVAELPAAASPVVVSTSAASFFDSAERVAVEALAADQVDFETFDRSVSHLCDELLSISRTPRVVLEPDAAAVLGDATEGQWQVPIGSVGHLGPAFQQMLAHRMASLYDPLVIWWSEGSSIVEPSCLLTKGLPHPDAFVALLDGTWAARQWRSVKAQTNLVSTEDVLGDIDAPVAYRSAAASDVGRVRDVNQDSFIERAEVGIWAVADGVGGHSHGEVASRMVCDAIADITPEAGLTEVIGTVRQRIDGVNSYLVRAEQAGAARSGSTAVVLLARGSQFAVLWAGDSRLYRWRDGLVTQITRDHSEAESGEPDANPDSHAITRAVGGDVTLELDLILDSVRPGDRFLLCTDGLTREVTDARMAELLSQASIRAAVDALIAAALEGGGQDNVTALVVEAVA